MALTAVLLLLLASLLAQSVQPSESFPLIPSHGQQRLQRPAHQQPLTTNSNSCCGGSRGMGTSVRTLFVCYVFNQRLARRHQSASKAGSERSAQHHPMFDDYVGAAGVKVVGHTRRRMHDLNETAESLVALAHPPASGRQGNSREARPGQESPVLSAQTRHVKRAYHHTLFSLSSTSSAPLAATLLLPFSEQTEQSSSTTSPPPSTAGDNDQQNANHLNFWIMARWHKATPSGAELPLTPKCIWKCRVPLPDTEQVSEDHWLAINMQMFFNKTFSSVSLPAKAPLFLPRTRMPNQHGDRLQMHVLRSWPGNQTHNGVHVEELDTSEQNSPCGQLVKLPCVSRARHSESWEPFLAIANGPAENVNVIQQYNNSRLRRPRPRLLSILPFRRSQAARSRATPRRTPMLPSPA